MAGKVRASYQVRITVRDRVDEPTLADDEIPTVESVASIVEEAFEKEFATDAGAGFDVAVKAERLDK